MHLRLVIAATCAALLATQAAAKDVDTSPTAVVVKLSPAQLRATELDRLFGQLHQADAQQDPAAIENKIWANWMRSDSVTAELLLGQATAAMNARENDTSEKMLDQLIASYPDYTEALNKRATLLFMLKRYDESLADIERVLELEPRHFGAISGRGMIYQVQGKTDLALDAFREALTINPHMAAIKAAVMRMEKDSPEI